MANLKAGSLNRRISIEKPSPTRDAYGQVKPTGWSSVLTCWASIRAATSKEVYAASGFTSDVSHVIIIRYPSVRVRSGMRILYDGRTFTVQAADDPDEDRAQLKILALEVDEGTP